MHRPDLISRRPLSVVLRRDGEQLTVEYHRQTYGKVDEAQVPWAALGTNVQFDRRQGLAALVHLLDGGGEKDLLNHLTREQSTNVGKLLFQLLFPDERVWRRVLRALFDAQSDDAANPPRHPVRLRIVTQDPALLGVPWRLTAWRGYWLVDYGWTFEMASDVGFGPNRYVNLHLPARVLVVAPLYERMPEIQTAAHLAHLRDALGKSYESTQLYREVRSRTHLRDALSGMQPEVIYYYGHADITRGQVCLLLGGPGEPCDPLLVADLRNMMPMRGRLPRIVFLNGCKTGAAGWQSAGHQLSPEIPLVLAQRTTAWSKYAGEFAIRWLVATLRDSWHPIDTLHELEPEYSRLDFQWATPCLHSSFEEWTTGTVTDMGPDPDAPFRIDREAQRGLVDTRIRALVTSDEQRVEAFIAYAIPRNLAWKFGWQAAEHINTAPARYTQVKVIHLRLPDDRKLLDTHLLEEMRRQLDIDPGEDLRYALRRLAPRAQGNEKPILWLDWGLFGPARRGPLQSPSDPPEQPQPQLTRSQIKAWLRLACHQLSQSCPDEIRIVSYLAIETEDVHKLKQAVDELILDPELDRPAYRCTLVGPLPDLMQTDILHFLREPRNSRCPPGLVRTAVGSIYAATQGAYEAVVGMVHRGNAIGWKGLLDQLNPSTLPAGGEEEPL